MYFSFNGTAVSQIDLVDGVRNKNMLRNLRMRHLALVVGLAVAGMTANASGAVIAQYNFNNSADRTVSIDAEPNSTASAFVTSGGGGFSSASNSAIQTYANITSSSVATAISSNDYFGFTVTPSLGQAFSLTNLTFDSTTRFQFGDGGSVSFFVRSSLDGFTSDLASYSQTSPSTVAVPPSSSVNDAVARNVSLSGVLFQNQPAPIQLRIYFYENIGNSTATDAFRVDNVILNGTVAEVTAAVPEPASIGIAMLGGLALLARRR